jgi:hypothetical protein
MITLTTTSTNLFSDSTSDRLDRCEATRCATRLGLICLGGTPRNFHSAGHALCSVAWRSSIRQRDRSDLPR